MIETAERYVPVEAVPKPDLTDRQLMLLHDAAAIAGSLGLHPQDPEADDELYAAVQAIEAYVQAVGHGSSGTTAGEFVASLHF